ncbi:MAG: DegQ family serine endoprotease [Steroidobacteraceae bacterium]
MFLKSCSGRYLVPALSALALSACSPNASTASPARVAAPPIAVPAAPLVPGLPDFTGLVQTYGPAVVNVQVTAKRPQRGGQEEMMRDRLRQFGIPMPDLPQGQSPAHGTGSGFIVSTDGYILTNRHVVQDATEVKVKLTDRREFSAKVIGMDESTDVAVIKIEGSNLPTVRIGDPEKLKPGQWVVAIGSPFGMENSVTAGIVSATSRRISGERFVPFIQTDVAVNPGNSGGPLFNLNGEVVGINSQIYSQSGGYMGVSFAIPIDMANNVREQLVTTGKVTRGRIGVLIQPLDADLAESFGLDRPHGALVTDVTKGEAADKAGIKPGDIILSVGGKPVASEVLLPSLVAAIKPGTSTEFEIWRDGKQRTFAVKVGENKESGAKAALVPGGRGENSRGERGSPEREVLGLSVRPLTAQEKQQAHTAGSLVVEDVSGPAEQAGIQPDDIILGVGSTNVTTAAELRAAVAQGKSRHVPLRVQRGEIVQFAQILQE